MDWINSRLSPTNALMAFYHVIIQWLCEVDMLHEAKTTSATDCSNVRGVAVCFACRNAGACDLHNACGVSFQVLTRLCRSTTKLNMADAKKNVGAMLPTARAHKQLQCAVCAQPL